MKNMFKFAVSTAALTLLLGSVAVQADDAQTLAKIDEQLAQLKVFEYGQDGNPLTDLERTIFQLPTDSPLRGTIEQKLIDALGESNDIGRGVICRQLRVIGTDNCIPAVAPLLTDPKLAQFARYTLQGLGSDAALKAMHQALAKTSGKLQIGLLNSLSDRCFQPMRNDCIRLLGSNDSTVCAAATRALGRLGGADVVSALTKARTNATGQLALDIDLALLNCAESLLHDGDRQAAAKIYTSFYQPAGPFRLAGLRGLVIAQPRKAADLLVSAIGQTDSQLATSAIHLTAKVAGRDVTAKLVGLLKQLPVERQILLLKALGVRGDPAAAPAVAAATSSDDAQIRTAALEALGGLSGPDALDALLKVATGTDATCQRVARASLTRLQGADRPLATIAKGADENIAVEAIHALAARKAHGVSSLMLQLAKSDPPLRRAAAIEALGDLAGTDELGLVVQLVLHPKTPTDIAAAEQSLGQVLVRINTPADRATALLKALPGAPTAARAVLIRQLAKAGTPAALRAVRAALSSADPAASDAAIVALANWPDQAAGNDLITLVDSARTPELKTTALNGYLRIASASDDPATMFRDVLNKLSSVADKKLVLDKIGLNCESLEAIDMTQSLLDDPQLSAVAAIATIRIAYKLRISHKDAARAILENVLAKVDHPDVQKRAQDVLNDIDKYEDYIMEWVALGPFVDKKIVNGEQSYKTVFEPAKADTSDLDWKPLTDGKGSWDFNLEATFGALDHCSAYVKTMVWSPIDQDIQVEGGCDDALKIWVNGKLVYEKYTVGGCTPRTMLAPATLRKGWNELKLKATDHEGGWQFGCRIRRPNGAKLDGLKYEAR